jgi:GNAT superfamily N-acetyltransferase
MSLSFREANRDDVPAIIRLLADDEIGATREGSADPPDGAYLTAFSEIEADPYNTILVAETGGEVVACLQLTITPELSRRGMKRATIEGVRVRSDQRGAGAGRALIEHALGVASSQGCALAQLTTDERRPEARRFYESLGFEATHVGMKRRL